MSPAEQDPSVEINKPNVGIIFSGSKQSHTHRPPKKTLNFNIRPEPPVGRVLDSVLLCPRMLVV